MEYFCAQCARMPGNKPARHKVSELAADLREISKKDITRRLEEILNTDDMQDKEKDVLDELSSELHRFVNSADPSDMSFVFKGCEIEKCGFLEDSRWENMELSGNLRLPLSWLVEKYLSSSSYKGGNKQAWDILASDWGDRLVYDRHIRFLYKQVENEKMLDCITSADNDPFTDDSDPNNIVLRGYLRACPYCGHHVGRAVGRAKEIIVGLSGSPRAGKTSCLVSLVSALESGHYNALGLKMDVLQNDPAWASLHKELEKYKDGYAVVKTPEMQTAVPAYSLLVHFQNERRVVTFVDMPGEFWQKGGRGISTEFHTQYMNIYRNLDCIWFFISKLSAYNINLGKGEQEWQKKLLESSGDTVEIIRSSSPGNFGANLTTLKDFLEPSGVAIPPVAVILTKAELELGAEDAKKTAKYELFPVDNGRILTSNIAAENQKQMRSLLPMSEKKPLVRVLNEEAYFYIARQVREFFRYQNPGVLDAVEENCPFRTYLSMAAYGHSAPKHPDDLGIADAGTSTKQPPPKPPMPYHEILPLIWTLSIMGAVGIEHRCLWKWHGFFGQRKTEEGSKLIKFRYKRIYEISAQENALAQDEKEIFWDTCRNMLMLDAKSGRECRFTVTQIEGRR